MNVTTATRGSKDVKLSLGACTDFVMHKRYRDELKNTVCHIIDYAEHRLRRYIMQVIDAQQKIVLLALLSDYRDGNIAIAWKRGNPIYVRILKDK